MSLNVHHEALRTSQLARDIPSLVSDALFKDVGAWKDNFSFSFSFP